MRKGVFRPLTIGQELRNLGPVEKMADVRENNSEKKEEECEFATQLAWREPSCEVSFLEKARDPREPMSSGLGRKKWMQETLKAVEYRFQTRRDQGSESISGDKEMVREKAWVKRTGRTTPKRKNVNRDALGCANGEMSIGSMLLRIRPRPAWKELKKGRDFLKRD